MRLTRRLLASLGLLATLAPVPLLGPGSVLASCTIMLPLPESIAQAPIVFVGTVTDTAEQDRWASVTVDEIWKGEDVPPSVVVRGGPGGNVGTSIDRTYQRGVRYLFVPGGDPASGLTDNACSPTTEWSADLVAFRPASVLTPTGDPADDGGDVLGFVGGLLGPIALVAVVSVVLLGIGLLARGRQDA